MSSGVSVAAFVLGIALVGSSCSDVPTARVGTPRLELELAVEIDSSFSGKLGGGGEELARTIAERVLARSDVGLRFYPVLTGRYAEGDPRPEYLLTVVVRDLKVARSHRNVAAQGQEPYLEPYVTSVECAVAAKVEKRRSRGPALVVGSAQRRGKVDAKHGKETAESYPLAGAGDLRITQSDLLRAIEKSLQAALRELVPPIDREFAIQRAGTTETVGR